MTRNNNSCIDNAQYRSLYENSRDIILFIRTRDGQILEANASALHAYQYSREELLSMTIYDLRSLDTHQDVGPQMAKAGSSGLLFETYHCRKNGEIFPVEVSSQGTFVQGENALLSVVRDITNRRRAEEALRESEGKYRNLFNNAEVGIFRSRLDGSEVLEVNRKFLEIVGMTLEETLGKPSVNLWADPKERKEMIKLLVADGSVSGFEYKMLNKREGSVRNCLTSLRLYREQGILEGSILDITERKQAEAALQESERRYRELSIVDGLTQLYNSRFFYHQLKMEIDRADRYGHPLTLLLLDLDDFKRFNDAYGHVEGDQVLMRLGRVVKRCLRQTDSAYRYGGEEFTILLPMTTSADSAFTAERIRAEFKKESFSPIPGQDVYVTVSIGLAQYKPQEEIKAFVHRVDQLMYQGKKLGKDRVCSE